jgi:hypothetical protein
MARAGLQWTLDDLAAASSVSRMSCIRFESGGSVSPETSIAIKRALESAGAEFVGRAGRIGVTVEEKR